MTVAQLGTALDSPPPQNADAERATLGSVLLNNHAFYRVIDIIGEEDFFQDANRTIFATMRVLADQSQPIDLLTVKSHLAKNGKLESVGGYAYVTSLVDFVPNIANVESYARDVRDKSMRRRIIFTGNWMMNAAQTAGSGEAPDILASADRQLFAIAERQADKRFASIGEVTRDGVKQIETVKKSGLAVIGVPTGYVKFNQFTSGFHKQDMIVIAARPAMGKSTLMLNIAENIAVPDHEGRSTVGADRLHGVAIFSLEMSKEQLGQRMLSSQSGIPLSRLRDGFDLSAADWSKLAAAQRRIDKASIHIDDTPAIDALELRAKVRRLRRECDLDLVMLDYLQLMTLRTRTSGRREEVDAISRALKNTAKEVDLPVVVLSQLSRQPEQRSDHRPQLSDLRESGQIEQDADLVAFIYRDEVYNKDSDEKNVAEIIIAKQRNGPIGEFKIVFRNDLTKFFNYEPQPGEYADRPERQMAL